MSTENWLLKSTAILFLDFDFNSSLTSYNPLHVSPTTLKPMWETDEN